MEADRSLSNEELTIIVKGIEGDFLIDHVLLTSRYWVFKLETSFSVLQTARPGTRTAGVSMSASLSQSTSVNPYLVSILKAARVQLIWNLPQVSGNCLLVN